MRGCFKTVRDRARGFMEKNMPDEKGIGTMELLAILGICLVILGATLIAAEMPISTWWTNKVLIWWR